MWVGPRAEKGQGLSPPPAPLLRFQVKLLQSLGLKSALITDGSTPINLFNTALGLLGVGSEGQPQAQTAAGKPGPTEGLLLGSTPVPPVPGGSHVVP